MTERIGFAMREAATHDTRETRPIAPAAPVLWPAPPAIVPRLPAMKASSRITLRVDDKQRLQLRLASAHLGKTRQIILIDALDHYLRRVVPSFLHDPCPCIQGESATGGECCQRHESQ
jgi:hypothetical protein